MRRKQIVGIATIVFVLAGLLVACSGPEGPNIEAVDVWARPTIKMDESESGEGGMGMAGTGAVFMLLTNTGGEADRLLGGQTDVAEVVEIHETVSDGEIMKMQMLPNGLEIPAGGEVLLKPGSYHIMLIGIKRDLQVGDTFTLDLQLEKSGTLSVQPKVREP